MLSQDVKVYNFNECNSKGKLGEEIVANFAINLGYEVRQATKHEQLSSNFDLEISHEKDTKLLEVKTEFKTYRTNNIFFETKVNHKLGWSLKYSNDSKVFIVWTLLKLDTLMTLQASRLKEIEYFNFPKRMIQNETYQAEGYLIPLEYLRPKCKVTKLQMTDFLSDRSLSKFREYL